jgi:acyl carrier protein
MTDEEIKQLVLGVLGDIAPEAEMDQLDPETSFRDQLDIDSMDFLNFVIGLHQKLAVDIPEADYPKLANLSGAVAYVQEKTAATAG